MTWEKTLDIRNGERVLPNCVTTVISVLLNIGKKSGSILTKMLTLVSLDYVWLYISPLYPFLYFPNFLLGAYIIFKLEKKYIKNKKSYHCLELSLNYTFSWKPSQ